MQFVASQTQIEMSVRCDDTNHGRYYDCEVEQPLLAADLTGNSTDCVVGNY